MFFPYIGISRFIKIDYKEYQLIKQIFKEAKNELLSKNKYLSLLVFDDLGLSERSPTNCLNQIHLF